jgi:hypothetical protein
MRITRPLTPLHASATRLSALTSIRDLLCGAGSVGSDRRTRPRLRELCDEVLASFRVASDRDLFSEEDRRAARVYLPTVSHRVSRG